MAAKYAVPTRGGCTYMQHNCQKAGLQAAGPERFRAAGRRKRHDDKAALIFIP